MNQLECETCKISFKSKYNLKSHLTTNKKCLKIRGIELQSNFICKGCESSFANKANMTIHMDICAKYIIMKKEEIYIENIEKLHLHYSEKIKQQEQQILQQENTIKELRKMLQQHTFEYENHIKLQVRYEDLEKQHEKTITKLELKIAQCDAVFQDIIFNRIHNEAVIDIELDENSEKDINENESEEYKLQPLDLGNDMYIESREDGYINITNLCKAGGKKFNHWNTLDRTKSYLKALSNDTGIPASLLVTHQTGLGSNQATWVHPYVAINIAQWISPQFDVKISSWIYEVMLTGKIDISKTKSFQQLRLENKEQKIKIQYLTKKYVKSQPRIQYTEKNVIYILTTPSHKKEGKYILGKATNLTNRLSVYNKTDEHEVVYYQSCGDEETMSIVEQFVFQRLKDYREQANRERFILPEGKTIDLFIDVIKKTIG